MTTIVSDKKQAGYTDFIAQTLDTLSAEKVKGIAVVALLKNGESFTGKPVAFSPDTIRLNGRKKEWK